MLIEIHTAAATFAQTQQLPDSSDPGECGERGSEAARR